MGKHDNWYPKGTLLEPFTPRDIDDVTAVFAANVAYLMPPADSIPDDFSNSRTKMNQFFSDCFYSGIKNLQMYPKEDIDPAKAWRHLQTIMGSYEPKHEYKEAAFAYLASLWFDDITWEAIR